MSLNFTSLSYKTASFFSNKTSCALDNPEDPVEAVNALTPVDTLADETDDERAADEGVSWLDTKLTSLEKILFCLLTNSC